MPTPAPMTPAMWLPRAEQCASAPLRLVCFAHAGGGAAPFIRWGRRLPDGVGLCPVRRPGREAAMRVPPLTDVHAIADGAFAALETLPPAPTVLLGHSLGAAVAFEVARRMEAAGRPLRLLVASARRPLHLPPRQPLLAGLPDAQFIDALDRTYGGIPPAVRAVPELMAMMLPALRADLVASEGYRAEPAPPLACPIRVCTGVDDRAVPAEDVPRWRELGRAVDLRAYPGGHFYLFERDECLDDLRAELLRLGAG